MKFEVTCLLLEVGKTSKSRGPCVYATYPVWHPAPLSGGCLAALLGPPQRFSGGSAVQTHWEAYVPTSSPHCCLEMLAPHYRCLFGGFWLNPVRRGFNRCVFCSGFLGVGGCLRGFLVVLDVFLIIRASRKVLVVMCDRVVKDP